MEVFCVMLVVLSSILVSEMVFVRAVAPQAFHFGAHRQSVVDHNPGGTILGDMSQLSIQNEQKWG